jgi:maltose-binding protein MalE
LPKTTHKQQELDPYPNVSKMGYFDDHFEEIAAEQYEADQAAEEAEAAEAEAQEQADAEAEGNS